MAMWNSDIVDCDIVISWLVCEMYCANRFLFWWL
jgi:hypothetical protein